MALTVCGLYGVRLEKALNFGRKRLVCLFESDDKVPHPCPVEQKGIRMTKEMPKRQIVAQGGKQLSRQDGPSLRSWLSGQRQQLMMPISFCWQPTIDRFDNLRQHTFDTVVEIMEDCPESDRFDLVRRLLYRVGDERPIDAKDERQLLSVTRDKNVQRVRQDAQISLSLLGD